jgi:hypothetical protein
MIEFKFDHTQGDVLDACGVKAEQIESLFEKINDLGQEYDASSEIVEKLGTNFTSTELAFIVNHLQLQMRDAKDPLTMLRDMMELGGDSINIEENNDNNAIPIPLSKGGEA